MVQEFINMQNIKHQVRTELFRCRLLAAARAGQHVYQNELNKINNLPCTRESDGKVKIRNLFIEYWDLFALGNAGKIRPSVTENVVAMMHCRDFSQGYLTYECPKCHHTIQVGLSCNSRFCVSCGNRYRAERTLAISKLLLNKTHRQFVFSMSYQLRPFFAVHEDRDALLDILFQSVEEAFDLIIRPGKKAKKENRQFGYVSFLHTYGRPINWHPHIHVLICEGYMDNKNKFHKYDYFHYDKLRVSFMYALHNRMLAYFKANKTQGEYEALLELTKRLAKEYPKGYYVYGPKLDNKYNNNRISTRNLTSYIARYASHPAIAESRITNVDYKNHTVTYFYTPHEYDDLPENERLAKKVTVTESVFEFIKKLIRHIPNKGFHTIRYYGFYSKHSSNDLSKYTSLYTKTELKKMKHNIGWNRRMKLTYHYEPLLCHCGTLMEFIPEDSFFPPPKDAKRKLSIFDFDENGDLYEEEFYNKY